MSLTNGQFDKIDNFVNADFQTLSLNFHFKVETEKLKIDDWLCLEDCEYFGYFDAFGEC